MLTRRASPYIEARRRLGRDADTNMLFAAINKDWSATVLPEPSLAKQGVAYGFRKSVRWSRSRP